jgi:hypothetical protein
MRIMALSGIDNKSLTASRLQKLTNRLSQLNPQSFAAHLVRNEISRLNGTAETMPMGNLRQYAAMLQDKAAQYAQKPGVAWLIQKELKLIGENRFTGAIAFPTIGKAGRGRKKVKRFFKKVGSGIKKVARVLKTVSLAAPRNAFLGLVKLNLRGLASKLKRVNQSKVVKLWERLGGRKSSLLKAISTGANKRPLLGGKGSGKSRRRVRGIETSALDLFNTPIRGIGIQPMETEPSGGGSGTAAAGAAAAGAAALVASNPATGGTAAAIIAASAPVLIAFTKLLKSEGMDVAEGQMDLDTGEIVEPGTGSLLGNIMDVAGSIAQAAGIAPGLPSGNYAVNDVEPGASETAGQPSDESDIEDAAKTTAFPAIGIAAVAGIGLFLLMKRK